MAFPAWLMKAGSMTEAVGTYVPAMILQKGIGLGRVVLLAYLMRRHEAQYGLWGIGLMIALLAAPVLTLGADQGLRRYVGFYEARGQLAAFHKRMQWSLAIVCAAVGLLWFISSGFVTRWVIVSRVETGGLTYAEQHVVCLAALANALLVAIYHNLQGFLTGMRVYRLVSVLEVMLSVTFTVLAVIAWMVSQTGLGVLTAHFLALLLTTAVGSVLLHQAINRSPDRSERPASIGAESVVLLSGQGAAPATVGNNGLGGSDPDVMGALRRVLGFGVAAMAGTLLWLVAQYVSLYLTNRRYGKEEAGVFALFLQLSAPVFFIANAAWAVVFSHVARRWESGDRESALAVLQTAYKSIVIAMMTLTIVVYATSGGWVRLLPDSFRRGQPLLSGLLMFFQVLTHLMIMHILVRLHERPIIIALATLAGAGANVALAIWWMPHCGPAGAALAAGVGMYIGAGAVTLLYLLSCESRLHFGTYVLLAAPILLAGPFWLATVVWGGVLLAAVRTTWLLSHKEKKLLLGKLGDVRRALRGKGTAGGS